MNKLNKVYSFHISKLEKDAITEIRKHDINVSRYLRDSLRGLETNLRLNYAKSTNDKEFNKILPNITVYVDLDRRVNNERT